MTKVFEDYFSELQADMIDICLEYVDDKAEQIYIYCSNENGIISSDFFYKINNTIVENHKLNDAINKNNDFSYDTSIERQKQVMEIINGNIKKIDELCKKHQQETPTEIKIIYDVKNNSLNADYKYDLIYSNDPVLTPDDIAEEWFDNLKNI